MAAKFFVPGPALVAVGIGGAKAMVFLGQTQEGAHVRETLFSSNVMCDVGGHMMPTDELEMGKQVVVSMQLVRFEPTVMNALMARFWTGTAGAVNANEIGTLLLAENKDFVVMVKSAYAPKTFNAGNLRGIRLLHAKLDGDHSYPIHTREQAHQLTFKGMTKMDFTTMSGECWDDDVTGFPNSAIN